jgi:hypothetical protein
MSLGSTQPLTKMSTKNLFGGKGRTAHKADNLTAIYEPFVYKKWEPRCLTTLWASTACYRDSYIVIVLKIVWNSLECLESLFNHPYRYDPRRCMPFRELDRQQQAPPLVLINIASILLGI